MDMNKAAGDNQFSTKESDHQFFDQQKAKDESLCMTIGERGDGKIISSSSDSSLSDKISSVSVESGSRKYLSIAQIVTNMKARWEIFVMENEIARCKSREQKERRKNANSARGMKIKIAASKSPSAPHLSTPSDVLSQESHKLLDHEDSIKFNTDLKKILSDENIRYSEKDDEKFYNIKPFTYPNDFERDSIEWKTADHTDLGSLKSDKNCYTAEDKSSNEASLSSGSRKLSKNTCDCPTHIVVLGENSTYDDASIEDKDFSFGQTYTIADTNSSCKSCSLNTSSSFGAESANHQKDSGTTDNKSSGSDGGHLSTHLKLEELCREYDSVILARNDPVVWNVRTSSTQINQCYNNWRRETPDEKICSNVSWDSDFIYSQKVCKKCTRGIFPGQAKFENSIQKHLAWHKNCFRCVEITCQKELHNFDHILYNSEPFCYQHYIEKSKASRCKSCCEFIADETYTYAIGEFWHQRHFNCGYCRSSIINSEFISVENNVICLPCHTSLFKKNCQSCGNLIEIHQQFVHSGERFWHSNDSCMQCETCSNSLIERVRFYRKDSHLYCNRFCSQQRGPP